MKPYYEDDSVTIYHGDCREVLPEIATPDIVFTDPPYGIAYQAMRGGLAIQNDESEDAAVDIIRIALSRTRAAQAHYVCCDWRSLSPLKAAMEAAGLPPKSCIVWDKLHGVQNLDRFAKRHEFILYAGPFGGQPTFSTDIWAEARDFDPDHPTPKPLGLISRAVQAASAPRQLVLDPFMGSGSTLRAAKNLSRRAIGIELEERYCEIAAQRLAQEVLDLEAAA